MFPFLSFLMFPYVSLCCLFLVSLCVLMFHCIENWICRIIKSAAKSEVWASQSRHSQDEVSEDSGLRDPRGWGGPIHRWNRWEKMRNRWRNRWRIEKIWKRSMRSISSSSFASSFASSFLLLHLQLNISASCRIVSPFPVCNSLIILLTSCADQQCRSEGGSRCVLRNSYTP